MERKVAAGHPPHHEHLNVREVTGRRDLLDEPYERDVEDLAKRVGEFVVGGDALEMEVEQVASHPRSADPLPMGEGVSAARRR